LQTPETTFGCSLTLESLFSGKLHALLCREYTSGRVKGRDYYDFIWFMGRGVSPDLLYLEAKLKQSGKIEPHEILTLSSLKELLNNRFSTIDYSAAKNDILPFIDDASKLEVWSKEFFKSLANKLE